MRSALTLLALALTALALNPQTPSQSPAQPDPPHRDWKALWITHPTAPLREPVVLHFRRTLSLPAAPASYVVRVSADNRFVLYVNGRRVGDGPARGDLTHWRFERYDLAPLLKSGQNLITATVWNFGVYAPIAQMTDRTAFLWRARRTGESSISTPAGWLVEEEPGEWPVARVANGFWEYMASGPGEEMDAARYDWAWNDPATPARPGCLPPRPFARAFIRTWPRHTRPIRQATIPGAWFRMSFRRWSTRPPVRGRRCGRS